MAIWIVGFILLALVLWVALRPIPIHALVSHSTPVMSFAEAVSRIKAMQEKDNEEHTWDVCITKLFDHGEQTEHVIVFLHGFTTCPEQFNVLGQKCFEAGFNVFIPRLPQHGRQDRLTEALKQMTAEDLVRFGDEMVDIARALGKKVSVLGISGGATLVAWLAQNRNDVSYAFPIAAMFGLAIIPQRLTIFFHRLAASLPNFFMWWDPRTKADNPFSIYFAYPRYPISGLTEMMRLAIATKAQAKQAAVAAGKIVVIINDAEPGVSNSELQLLMSLWQEKASERVTAYHFEKEAKLPHDIITPGTPGVPTEIINTKLMDVIRAATMNYPNKG